VLPLLVECTRRICATLTQQSAATCLLLLLLRLLLLLLLLLQQLLVLRLLVGPCGAHLHHLDKAFRQCAAVGLISQLALGVLNSLQVLRAATCSNVIMGSSNIRLLELAYLMGAWRPPQLARAARSNMCNVSSWEVATFGYWSLQIQALGVLHSLQVLRAATCSVSHHALELTRLIELADPKSAWRPPKLAGPAAMIQHQGTHWLTPCISIGAGFRRPLATFVLCECTRICSRCCIQTSWPTVPQAAKPLDDTERVNA
jgi:hypothetical protein